MSAQHIGPFTIYGGDGEFTVYDGNNDVMTKCEAKYDMEQRDYVDTAEAEARAEQICAALNVAFYLAKVNGGQA